MPARRAVLGVGVLVALALAIAAALAARTGGSSSAPAGAPGHAALPAGTVGTFGHGAWCWFQDPRAVEVGGPLGRTYAGWIAWNGDITVGAFNPLTGRVSRHVVGHWIHDDHASPVLLVEPSRRLTVFWAVHNGRQLHYRTTLRPLDIRAWGPVHHLGRNPPRSLGVTYPNPVMVPAERDRLYMFWRGPDWGTDFLVRDGAHWSAPRELIVPAPGQRPYMKVAGNGYDRIALAFDDAHPGQMATNVYFAEVRAGSLWTAAGRRISQLAAGAVKPSDGDLVYNGHSTGVPSWVWDVTFDSRQHPEILYATFPSTHDHAYWYARFNGRRWVSHFLSSAGGSISPGTPEAYYSGGIAFDHSDPDVVYLSRKSGRWFRLERWVTNDGGATWHHNVVAHAGADQVRPVVPRGGGGGPISVMWMSGHYGAYIHYSTSIYFQTK